MACYRAAMQAEPTGEYSLACRLGVAECLAALQHMDEAATAYEEVTGLAAGHVKSRVFDRDAIRASLTTLYATLLNTGRLEEAMRFLRLAVALVPYENQEMTAAYVRRLADLYVAIGQRARAGERATPPATSGPATGAESAHDAFVGAAEQYLRLSRLLVMDEKASSEAAWQSAVNFDRANEPNRLISALEGFLVEHPENPLLPDALYRLGQALQAQGRYADAIRQYAANLARYPRTPAGMRSTVPMAQCNMALGASHYAEAEKTLLTVVDQPSEQGRYSPEALEYREALFLLGDLYGRWNKPARAISRLEEVLDRYPKDLRIAQAQFMLANAYRKSVVEGPTSQPTTTSAPVQSDTVSPVAARLNRAEELFTEVIRTLEERPMSRLSPAEQLYLKQSYLYRADCAFDQGQYERAVTLYEDVSRRFRTDPYLLPAYVQILNCYQRLGKDDQARVALVRVRWLLKSIPAERFRELPGGEDLAYWQGLLDWIEKSGLF
jgi:tetratricopeptide (TPR) repeat protein